MTTQSGTLRPTGAALVVLLCGGAIFAPDALRAEAIERLRFDPKELPATVRPLGRVVDGARWKDKKGENLLLLTQTGPVPSASTNEDDGRDAELYGYHFVRAGETSTQLWRVLDFERSCPFDLTVRHLPGALTITDLNANGVAETTFAYKLACRSDVSPARMKVIMHEGSHKYAVRGHMAFPKAWHMDAPRDMALDPAFADAPAAFVEHAKKAWARHEVEQTMDQL